MSCYFQSRNLALVIESFFPPWYFFFFFWMPLFGMIDSNYYCRYFHNLIFELQISTHSYFYLLILPPAAFLKNVVMDSSGVLITK